MAASRAECKACGTAIKEHMFQMRAADEAHTSVWSCDKCPLDARRISFSPVRESPIVSFPRRLHVRSVSDSKCASNRHTGTSTMVEITLQSPLLRCPVGEPVQNYRRPCAVPDPGYRSLAKAYYHQAGPHHGRIVRELGCSEISPNCRVTRVNLYQADSEEGMGSVELDGKVSTVRLGCGGMAYLYHRRVAGRDSYIMAMEARPSGWDSVRSTMLAMYSCGIQWPGILGFVTRDFLSTINNLSPRAWDSKRIQKKGAYYTPKVDGERVYVLVFSGVVHVFSKSRGHPHVGCLPLLKMVRRRAPVVIDAESTVSHGTYMIDMLTDAAGAFSPRERTHEWSLMQVRELYHMEEGVPIRVKGYYKSLLAAEEASRSAPYPTDGVISLWPKSTASRKMKIEKSIELQVGEDGSLMTDEKDVVFEGVDIPAGMGVGDIVEVRLKLCASGKEVVSRPLFTRVDKSKANSTSAVMAVLSSFGSVKRDDETRRRDVLMWCDSLRQHIFTAALGRNLNKKIVLDIGTGTGQSLDVLSSDKGVSYILVEPSKERCEMLKKRTGVNRIIEDPREIMACIRPLKSGAQVYAVANMGLSQIMADEELTKVLCSEVRFASCVFSAQFVHSELYDLCTYWSVPMVGCLYAYDDVDVGSSLVDALGVSMKRVTEQQCSVKWGRDKEYTEPHVTTQEYQPFSTITRGIDVLFPPNKEVDLDAWTICSKVYVIQNTQGT